MRPAPWNKPLHLMRTVVAIVTLLAAGAGGSADTFLHGDCAHHDAVLPAPSHEHGGAPHGSGDAPHAGTSHSAHAASGSEDTEAAHCTCLGACATATPAVLPSRAARQAAWMIDAPAAPLAATSEGLQQRLPYTLPYATAPPAA